jgi:ABC-type enterochelin transport system ATPase subunit
MTQEEFDKMVAHHELKLEILRDKYLDEFSLGQRIRLGLQKEWLQRTYGPRAYGNDSE